MNVLQSADKKQKKELQFEPYESQKEIWPSSGKHILAHYDEDSIVVYQAFKPSLADYAVENQCFGGKDYLPERMTWIKTNFLWMMFRCGWAEKKDQERVLAIWMKREAFERILSMATTHSKDSEKRVRLQWDPDHSPKGAKHPLRKAIQLGLKNILSFATGEDLIKIEDITAFVKSQFECVKSGDYSTLLTPKERVYEVSLELRKILNMDVVDKEQNNVNESHE